MYFGGMSGGPSGCVAMPAERDFLDRGKALMLYLLLHSNKTAASPPGGADRRFSHSP